MTDAARSYDQSYPPASRQFWRGWNFDCATGPDIPDAPAHASTWQADEQPLPIAGGNHRNRLQRAAERAFAGDRHVAE